MDRKTRSKMDMAERVARFFATRPDLATGVESVVEELAVVRGTFAGQSQAFRLQGLDQRALVRARNEVRRGMREGVLRQIQVTATRAIAEKRELADRYAVPSTSDALLDFAAAVASILASARSDEETLRAFGLPEGALARLEQQLAEWNTLQARVMDSRNARIAARAAMQGTAKRVRPLVRLIDAVLRPRLRSDAELAAAWRSASTVVDAALPAKDDAIDAPLDAVPLPALPALPPATEEVTPAS